MRECILHISILMQLLDMLNKMADRESKAYANVLYVGFKLLCFLLWIKRLLDWAV